jgi:protein associated with RNAse G/E
MKPVQYECMLRCKHVDGGVRYELPAHFCFQRENYFIYHRPHPLVIHHTKNKEFVLPNPELILVGDEKTNHCISIALSPEGKPVNFYVNINLPPEKHELGHEWRDLELDIRMKWDPETKWHVEVVDVEEFEKSDLTATHRKIALDEVEKLLKKINEKQFPFEEEFLKTIVPIDFFEKMRSFVS